MVSRKTRPGVSRLDVIVAAVLIITALGIVITFLYRGRGRADQTKCAYHLKVMGDGIYGFQNIAKGNKSERAGHDFLPPARIDGTHATWPVLIAPYMTNDQPLLAWDVELPFAGQPAQVRDAVFPFYFCPSRPRERFTTLDDPESKTPLSGAVGDYACVAGDGDPAFPWDGPQANGSIILGEVLDRKEDRVLRWRARTQLNELPRGLSNTLLLGEKHVPLAQLGATAAGDGSIYDARFPANSSRVAGLKHPLALSPTDAFNLNFGSCHPGIVQFLMADGSLSAYSTSMSPEVLGQLANRLK